MLLSLLLSFILGAQDVTAAESVPACTAQLTLQGTVGPATYDYLTRGLNRAVENKCASILFLINTPGGSLQTTRLIVEQILASPLPFLCLVHPEGGHAGSAGAIILQACHVAGAVMATNIGAATPISSLGEKIPEDLRKKLFEDTKSWVRGLTQLRKRNSNFGDEIIEKAKAVDASEALKLNAIDFAGPDKDSFLKFAEGRSVQMNGEKMATVAVGGLQNYEPDLRHNFLQFITDPEFAYLLFMASLGLLYFELTHPGALVPGVVGAIGLVLSFISFHKLDVAWGGVSLIFIGLAFLIAEAFVPSFGALGIGGLVAFVVGSLMLYDPASGYQLSHVLIYGTAGILGGLMLLLGWWAFRTRKIQKKDSVSQLVGVEARVVGGSMLEVNGELWRFECAEPVSIDDRVRIERVDGLILKVRRV